ncbi:DUF1254 domain-containing protein [Stenotrophomonas terrae]|uniref:DUF1254 domain-containing protein n=1 Tax=Stenotrophomonas terrae TaxID=405446 RepID=UPI00320808E6
MRITESYVRMAAPYVYFWAWPMVNVHNRRLVFDKAPQPGLMNGVLPLAPLNTLSMLHDYVKPEQRWVACPNQDVVYGAGVIALDRSPVIVQVPDFGQRFWVYQMVDIRTDSFAHLGAMYASKPGFYLLVGPDWQGETPAGVNEVFRAGSDTGMVIPRVFQDDTDEDRQAVQDVIAQIDLYPLAQFDGTMKRHDWKSIPSFAPAGSNDAGGETQWVMPQTFFDQLPSVLADARPLAGEQALYAQALALVAAIQQDASLKAAAIEAITQADADVIDPLLQFRNWGVPRSEHWSTVDNGAAFGTDYFARTAVAKSNIMVNTAEETKYIYQDLDGEGQRLNGTHRYQVKFSPGQTPPVDGFWSLTLYDANHFFVPNPIQRYSLGTKNKTLKLASDGALILYVQATSPGAALESNWLPAPANADFSLFLRAYWPKPEVLDGRWAPPAVTRIG